MEQSTQLSTDFVSEASPNHDLCPLQRAGSHSSPHTLMISRNDCNYNNPLTAGRDLPTLTCNPLWLSGRSSLLQCLQIVRSVVSGSSSPSMLPYVSSLISFCLSRSSRGTEIVS